MQWPPFGIRLVPALPIYRKMKQFFYRLTLNMQRSSKLSQADIHQAKPKQSIDNGLYTNISTAYEIKVQEEVARSPSD